LLASLFCFTNIFLLSGVDDEKSSFEKSFFGVALCALAAATSVSFVIAPLAVATTDSSSKTLRIGSPFGPTSSVPDPRARQNGCMSNRAGVSETLIGMSYEMQQFPRLAAPYRNLSATSWEIVIRADVKFHDGSTMKAQDVKASFDKLDVKDHSAHHTHINQRAQPKRFCDASALGPVTSMSYFLAALFAES